MQCAAGRTQYLLMSVLGLLAVTVVVLLTGLVLGYQFAEVYREKEHSLALVEHSLKITHHNALTSLPNRDALETCIRKIAEKWNANTIRYG